MFAIAITLLVLDLKTPMSLAPGVSLFQALLDQWPAYLGFLTSFVTIGIMWMNHHRLFCVIDRLDHVLLLLNGMLLLGVTVLPFPTSVMAEYIQQPGARTGALLYGITFLAIAIVFNRLWAYAAKDKRLIHPEISDDAVDQITRAYRLGPICYFAICLVALVNAPASVALNLVLALFFALPGELQNRVPGVR